MKPIKAHTYKALPHYARVETCDNSGAKILKIISVKGAKTVKGTTQMRKTVVPAVIVRQKKEYRRPDGTRIAFEDNAAVVLKDEKGNPKGTLIKGPIAKEAADRWVGISKIAGIVV